MARVPSQAGRAFCRLRHGCCGGAHFEHQQSALTVKADVTRLHQCRRLHATQVERIVKRHIDVLWSLHPVARGGLVSVCERCRAGAIAAAQIPPLGDTVGKRIFYCSSCDHYTWIDWDGSLSHWATSLSRGKSPATVGEQGQPQPESNEPSDTGKTS